MPKDELVGKTNDLDGQGAFEGTKGKKRVYHLWKERQIIQEMFKDVARSCRKKIRQAKAQLEFNLATSVKDDKKCFYTYINGTKRGKDNLHSLLDAGGI